MTSTNETVFHQMPWEGNIAKTMKSNGKQHTVTREMFITVAHDQRWPDVSTLISACSSKFAFVLLYDKSLNDWSFLAQWILFPSNLNVSLDFVSGEIEILGKQNLHLLSGPVIKCSIFPSVSWGIFGHVTCLEQSCTSENIWLILINNYSPKWKWIVVAIFTKPRRGEVNIYHFHRHWG